ncbi:MAG: protein kinase [Alphaproteobacteria bacterium]|nr:protein kinase [Alphaproteobacteria bacterium]
MSPIGLGPFSVVRPLGKGGMGEVWLGHHETTDTPVAIKVMTAENLRNEVFERAFEAEVQAVARLDHPGIIRLYDMGRVGAEAAAASDGQLVEGCPYLVMDLADGRDLRSDPPAGEWGEVRRVLAEILAALAHAHARGVIHRDIKPANVLWSRARDDQDRARVVLSDFGIAHAGDGGSRQGPTWGTPAYMAPERFTLEWRDLGPWTDLYSLGCLAYALLRGRPPFKGSPLAQAMQAHLYRPVPALRATFAVPDGVDGWLRTLLAKSAEERFPSAADAAWALDRLGAPTLRGSPSRPSDPSEPTEDEVTEPHDPEELGMADWEPGGPSHVVDPGAAPEPLGAEITWTDDTFDPAMFSVGASRTGRSVGRARSRGRRRPGFEAPPMPTDWRRTDGAVDATPLPGGGLRLFGLREVRLVARSAERDSLWAALREVHELRRPAGMLLRGDLGTGKTRLAEWLCERAVEVGAALPLRATHAPGHTALPLARMVAEHLRCVGLGPRTLRGRVHAWVQAQGVRDDRFAGELARLAALGAGVAWDTALMSDKTPLDPRATVRRFLAQLTRSRPVVLLLDDIAWGPTSLSFTTELLERGGHLPVLVLMTSRQETLEQHPAANESLLSLEGQGLLRTIEVGPLPAGHRVELVRNLLGVEESLAREVAERTAGNPLFTVSLVRDWVARGLLVEGPEGLQLADHGPLPLPDDLHAVWGGRLDRLTADLGPDARRALEHAAALGEVVDLDEWARACRAGGIGLPDGLEDALLRARLATRSPDRQDLRFAHAMVCESIMRTAQEEGRWEAAHDACVRMLIERFPLPSPLVRERLGRHLLAAGREDEAVSHLLAGVNHRLAAGDPAAGLVLLGDVEDALTLREDAAGQVLRLRTWQLRALALARQGHGADARAWARRLLDQLSRQDGLGDEGPLLRARTLLVLCELAMAGGELGEGRSHLAEARRLLGPDASFQDLADCQRLAGRLHREAGELEAAEDALSEAAELYGALQRHLDRAGCMADLAQVAVDRGDAGHAEGLLRPARERFAAARHHLGQADCLRISAHLAILQGDLAEAGRRLRRAQAAYVRLSSRRVLDCRLDRARLALEQGDAAEARRLVDAVSAAGPHDPGLQARISATRAAMWAREARWDAFDAETGDLGRLLLRSGVLAAPVRALILLCATWAGAAGQNDRAARVRALAS